MPIINTTPTSLTYRVQNPNRVNDYWCKLIRTATCIPTPSEVTRPQQLVRGYLRNGDTCQILPGEFLLECSITHYGNRRRASVYRLSVAIPMDGELNLYLCCPGPGHAMLLRRLEHRELARGQGQLAAIAREILAIRQGLITVPYTQEFPQRRRPEPLEDEDDDDAPIIISQAERDYRDSQEWQRRRGDGVPMTEDELAELEDEDEEEEMANLETCPVCDEDAPETWDGGDNGQWVCPGCRVAHATQRAEMATEQADHDLDLIVECMGYPAGEIPSRLHREIGEMVGRNTNLQDHRADHTPSYAYMDNLAARIHVSVFEVSEWRRRYGRR